MRRLTKKSTSKANERYANLKVITLAHMVYLGAYHKFLEYKKRSDEEIRFFKAYPQDEIRE